MYYTSMETNSRYTLTVGRTAPTAKLALGASIEIGSGRFDSNEKPVTPGKYVVSAHINKLSTKLDDGSRVNIHQIEISQELD
jgi:hypothetical protein